MLTGSITIFDRTQNRLDQAQIDDAVTRSEFQRLVRLDADDNGQPCWTEIAFTLEAGMLTFETDQDGLFLLMPAA